MTPLYDPMVAKLITWDVDREKATARMLRALGEYEIEPLTTLIPFHKAILATEQWAKGETCRDLTEDRSGSSRYSPEPGARPSAPGREAEEAAGGDSVERDYKVEVDGRLHAVKVIGAAAPAAGAGAPAPARRPPKRERAAAPAAAARAARRCPRRCRERCSRSRSRRAPRSRRGR